MSSKKRFSACRLGLDDTVCGTGAGCLEAARVDDACDGDGTDAVVAEEPATAPSILGGVLTAFFLDGAIIQLSPRYVSSARERMA